MAWRFFLHRPRGLKVPLDVGFQPAPPLGGVCSIGGVGLPAEQI